MADSNSTGATMTMAGNFTSEAGFIYDLLPWGELIVGTSDQLQQIGIGLGMHFPEKSDGRWKRKCIDPRGLEVKLSSWPDGRFSAKIRFQGRTFDDGVVTKRFTFGVDVREETFGDVYTGTADALVAAGIVPAGHFPGWPDMKKTCVFIGPDGTLASSRSGAREPGRMCVEQISKGQRPKYRCIVRLSLEILEARWVKRQQSENEWERAMNALPRPAPLINLPGFKAAPKAKPIPKYRVGGNVIYLAPRSEWGVASCPA